MLKFLRRGQRWVTTLFVIAVGGVFVFFMGWGAPSGQTAGGAIVQVGDHTIGWRAFERARANQEERFRQQLGDGFDASTMGDALNSMAASTLISQAILAMEARELGLAVAKEEIERLILRIPDFRGPDGRFDQQSFESWASREYGNQQNFIAEQRRFLLANKMVRLLQTNAQVSEGEARAAVRQRLEEVSLALAVLDPANPPEEVVIGDDQLQGALVERAAELQALYDSRPERYDVPEQVRARHILFELPEEDSEEAVAAVRAEAETLLASLREGADFEAAAREHSDDQETRESGGDLGLFQRGQVAGSLEEVAFALEPGALSEPVQGKHGFHLLRVDEHQPAAKRSFEEVREELARELLTRELALVQVREQAEGLAAGVREGRGLEDVARDAGLTLERTGMLKRRVDGHIPSIGTAPELMATAFTLETGESSGRVFEVGERLLLLEVLERKPAPEVVVVALASGERQELLRKKRVDQIDVWLDSRRQQLLDSGDLVVDLEAIR